MQVQRNAKLRLKSMVPPGESLLGVFPFELFRIEKIDTLREQPYLSLVRAGVVVPLDGQVHEVRGYERTLGIGNYLALHVKNDAGEMRDIELQLSGLSLENETIEHQLLSGFFTMEHGAHDPVASSPGSR